MRSHSCGVVVFALASACGHGDDAAIPGTDATGDRGPCGADDYDEGIACVSIFPARGVDLLFVIDRSARMGPAQAKLARAMPALVEALGALPEDVGVRVAFTAAEDPVPPCPEVGPAELLLASCREHLQDFSMVDGDDASATACTDVCELEAIATVPHGRPDGDGPWIEWDRHGSNLGGVDVAAALACAAPQGIAGCGFPAPIGASIRAIEQFSVPYRPMVAVLVSDAADCTLMDDDGDLVFDPDSNQTFWTDPDADAPMPAICWNAGVTCEGPADGYDACVPADKDFAGEPAGWMARVLTHAEAVLSAAAPVEFVGIVGVPEGWQRGDAIPFADAEDPAIQREYGIGPSCVAADGSFGLPPVRVRAFVEANPVASDGDAALWSICAEDWAPAMRAIAARARSMVEPSCVSLCVADLDAADGLQHDCAVSLTMPVDNELVTEAVPRCDGSLDAAIVPEGASACWLPRAGAARSAECSDAGWNLEIDVHWPGPIPAGADLVAACTASRDRTVDCPGLP